MGREVLPVFVIKATGALLWLMLSIFLMRMLAAEIAGRALLTFATLGFATAILTAGPVQVLLKSGNAPAQQVLRFIALVKLLAVGSTVVLLFAALAILPDVALAFSITFYTSLVASGCLTMLLAARARALGGSIGVAIPQSILPVAGALLALWLGDAYALNHILIGLFAGQMIGAVWLIGVIIRATRPVNQPKQLAGWRENLALFAGGQAFVWFQNLDLLAILLIGDPALFAPYLLARRCAGVVALLSESMRFILAPRLARASENGENHPLPKTGAIHAGLGAGLLLILGAALLPLWYFEVMTGGGVAILICLCLRQAAPIWFGFPNVRLAMSGHARRRAKILVAHLLAGLPLVIIASHFGPVTLAVAILVSAAWLNRALRLAVLQLGGAGVADQTGEMAQKMKSSSVKSSRPSICPSIVSTRKRSAPKRIMAP